MELLAFDDDLVGAQNSGEDSSNEFDDDDEPVVDDQGVVVVLKEVHDSAEAKSYFCC
jgi:hypothetical protein